MTTVNSVKSSDDFDDFLSFVGGGAPLPPPPRNEASPAAPAQAPAPPTVQANTNGANIPKVYATPLSFSSLTMGVSTTDNYVHSVATPPGTTQMVYAEPVSTTQYVDDYPPLPPSAPPLPVSVTE